MHGYCVPAVGAIADAPIRKDAIARDGAERFAILIGDKPTESAGIKVRAGKVGAISHEHKVVGIGLALGVLRDRLWAEVGHLERGLTVANLDDRLLAEGALALPLRMHEQVQSGT